MPSFFSETKLQKDSDLQKGKCNMCSRVGVFDFYISFFLSQEMCLTTATPQNNILLLSYYICLRFMFMDLQKDYLDVKIIKGKNTFFQKHFPLVNFQKLLYDMI